MRKFAVFATFALALAAAGLGGISLFPVSASAETVAEWTAIGTNNASQENGGTKFRPGGVYRHTGNIDLENEGFSMSMAVGGEFRREDSWFAVTLSHEYSSAIGEYGGVNIQFKPVSTQAVGAGSMPAYVSLYTLGTAEGGSSASSLATVNASEIAERETPYEFQFSIFLKDGTWIVNYGIDTYTYRWNYAGLDLSNLKASLVFGGADVLQSDMNVTVNSFGSAEADGLLIHAAEAAESDGGVRITESAKRQGKIFYPVALSADREISVKFKINSAPGWQVNDGLDAWMAISLTSSPNAALPGSATFSTIIRAHEDLQNGIKHIGGFFFFNGKDAGGFSQGVNTRPMTEYNELMYKVKDGKITVTLSGETSRSKEVEIGAGAFPQGKVYVSLAFHDAQFASIIEKNEFDEEIGRRPNPDVSYWDVTIGEISEYGAPSVQADGKRINVLDGGRIRIPVELCGGSVQSFARYNGQEFETVSVSDYAVSENGKSAVIVLTEDFTNSLGLGTHTFRIVSSHPIAEYDGLQTDFTVTLVEAERAEVKTGSGTYRATERNDVKFSFALNDDVFVSLNGYGVTSGDYFYNPVTGNLYLKREYCKNLTAGEYKFDVVFEFSESTVSLSVKDNTTDLGNGFQMPVIVLSVAGGTLLLGAATAVVILLFRKNRREKTETEGERKE